MGHGLKWSIRLLNYWAGNHCWPPWSSHSFFFAWLWVLRGRRVKQTSADSSMAFSPWVSPSSGCSMVCLTSGIYQGNIAPLWSICWMWRSMVGQKCSSHYILFSFWLIIALRPLPLTFYESWLKCLEAGLCTWQEHPGKLLAAIALCCVHNSSKATQLPVQVKHVANASFWRVSKPWTNL